MSTPIASATRQTVRQRIGYNIGAMVASSASSAGSTTTLIDTYGLQKGGDDEYNGYQLMMTSGAGTASSNVGLKRWVTDHDGTAKQLTIVALSAATQSGDTYELWRPPFSVEAINDMISQAEAEVTPKVFVDKFDATTFTELDRYTYSIPSGFVAIHTIEYVSDILDYVLLHTCDAVWDELVDTDVTASVDDKIVREGSGCLKLVVAAGAAANDILATDSISSADLRNCTEVEIWIYSTVALTAGDIQLLLDNTASCVSPVESLNIPATSANTWTRHIISLANPQSDNAIISVGLKMVSDKGAFTLYADFIEAVGANSRIYKELWPTRWEIIRGTTDYIKLTPGGLKVAGYNTLLRILGYSTLTAMTADTSTSQVDPTYLVDRISGQILTTFAAPPGADMAERIRRGRGHLDTATQRRASIGTSLAPNTHFI